MSGGDTQKPAANWITLFNQAFKLLKYTAVRISNGPSETSVPLSPSRVQPPPNVCIFFSIVSISRRRGEERVMEYKGAASRRPRRRLDVVLVLHEFVRSPIHYSLGAMNYRILRGPSSLEPPPPLCSHRSAHISRSCDVTFVRAHLDPHLTSPSSIVRAFFRRTPPNFRTG